MLTFFQEASDGHIAALEKYGLCVLAGLPVEGPGYPKMGCHCYLINRKRRFVVRIIAVQYVHKLGTCDVILCPASVNSPDEGNYKKVGDGRSLLPS